MKNNNTIGEVLKLLRLKAGFTQENVAILLNISRSTYAYYELKKTIPDIYQIKVFSKLYGHSIDTLLSGEFLKKLQAEKIISKKNDAQEIPDRISQLTSEEKTLLAFLRTDEYEKIDEMITSIKSRKRDTYNEN